MPDFRFVQLGVIATTAIAVAAARPASTPPAPASCDVNSPQAKAFLATANSTFPKLDSVRRARFGMRTVPSTVTLVTAPGTCDSVVAAHNRFVNGKYAAYHVTTAAIAQAGGSFLVYVPPGRPSEESIFIYDSTLRFKAIY